MNYQFARKRSDAISEEKILSEMEKAAKQFNYVEFGWRDFNNVANVSASSVKKHFGNWNNGLEALRNLLKTKGLDLAARPFASNRIYSNRELFDEMERIWRLKGQRPSRTEWESSNPKISYSTYKQRFGGWSNACLQFIEYKSNGLIDNGEPSSTIPATNPKPEVLREGRDVPLRIRLHVLNRDNFRCVFCGRSPATDIGVKLHIDHIKPFSKGGKSSVENLQTLCFECNLGKSNSEI